MLLRKSARMEFCQKGGMPDIVFVALGTKWNVGLEARSIWNADSNVNAEPIADMKPVIANMTFCMCTW